jgi:hypothetical protein
MSLAQSPRRSWAYLNQHPGLVAVIVFGISLLVYVATLAPGLLWGGGDFAAFQTRIAQLRIDPDVLGHPLYVIAAHPFTWLPIGDLAYRANLSAAVLSAAALALLFRLITSTVHSLAAALLSVLMLMVSHTFWTYAVMPKSYSLNSLLLVGFLFLLLHWRRTQRSHFLIGAGGLLGIALLSHALFILFLPAALIFVWVCHPPRRRADLLKISAAFLVGAVPYVAVVVLGGAGAATASLGPSFIGNLLKVMTTAGYWPTGLIVYAGALIYQYPLTLAFCLIGVVMAWRRDRAFALLLVLIYLADVAFTWSWLPSTPRLSSYVQNFHFYLPSFVIAAIWAAYGFDWLLHWRAWTRAALAGLAAVVVVSPILLYAAAPAVAGPAMALLDIRSLPGRDAVTYLFSPWKNQETGARQLGEQILHELPPRAVIVADYSLYEVLNFLHAIEKQRTDVTVIRLYPESEEAIFQQLDRTRPLFIPDIERYYNLDLIRKYYQIEPYQSVYQLIPRLNER